MTGSCSGDGGLQQLVHRPPDLVIGLRHALGGKIHADLAEDVVVPGLTGTPLGIAAGVLTLAVLRSGLNAVGAPLFAHDVAMGTILLTVAVGSAWRSTPPAARRWIGC
jgi:hypothetical protein